MSKTPTPVLIKPNRSLNGIVADTVLEERHEHRMVITDHPVEQGASVSDHAYKLPARLTVEYAWSFASSQNAQRDPSFLKTMFNKLLQMQAQRTLFKVFTGKFVYNNMVLESVSETTSPHTENILRISAICREIQFAVTQLVQLSDSSVQLFPQRTASTQSQGQQNVLQNNSFNSTAFGGIPLP